MHSALRKLELQLIALLFTGVFATQGSASIPDDRMATIRMDYDPFIPNHGQFHPDVAFSTRSSGVSVWIGTDGQLFYRSGDGQLSEEFVAGLARPEGSIRAETRYSFFIGGNPDGWKSNVPSYKSITFGEVWDGIEVLTIAKRQGIEKLFEVAPHADVSRIRVRVNGARSLSKRANGALALDTGHGVMQLSPPVAWQETPAGNVDVVVSYDLHEGGYGFVVGEYDRNRALIIDPILSSTFIGTIDADLVRAVGVDSATGDVFVTGVTPVGELLPGFSGPAEEMFVARFSADLSTLTGQAYFGGSAAFDEPGAIALSADGSTVYVVGETRSADFPGTAGGAQSTPGFSLSGATPSDGFVTSFSSDFSTINQSTFFGGSTAACGISADEDIHDVAVDTATGDVFIAGQTCSSDIPGIAGGAQTTTGTPAAFAARLNAGLTSVLQSTLFGGSIQDNAAAIAVGATAVYITGETRSPDLPAAAAGFEPNIPSGITGYVASLSRNLAAINASTYLGGTSANVSLRSDALDVMLHDNGDVYVAGYTTAIDYPGSTGGAQESLAVPDSNCGNCGDATVARISADLSTLIQSTYYGGSGFEEGRFIASAASGTDIYIAGWTERGSDLPGVSGGAQANNASPTRRESYVARLTADLASIVQASYVGGSTDDQSWDMSVNQASGDVYVVGETGSSNFPTTTGAYQETRAGGVDGFITRFDNTLASGSVSGVDLSVAIRDSVDPVETNAIFSLIFTVTNASVDPATGVTLTVTLPAGIGLSGPAPAGCTTGNPVVCTLGTIAGGGSSQSTLNVTAPPTAGTVTTSAEVVANETDTDPSDNSSSEDTAVELPAGADLTVSFDALPAIVDAGSVFVYSLDIQNLGPDTATSVVVTVSLGSGITFDSSSPPGTCTPLSASSVRCDFGTLNFPGNESVTLSVTAPLVAGDVTTSATIRADQGDPVPGNDSASSTVTVVLPAIQISDSIEPANDLTLPFGPVTSGSSASATVTVTNSDSTDRTITIDAANVSAPFAIVDIVQCNGVTLAPAAACTLEISFAPTASGTASGDFDVIVDAFTATVSMTGSGADAVADLAITKSASVVSVPGSDPGTPPVDFTVGVTNLSGDPVDALVTDVLPPQFVYVSHSGGSYDPATGEWAVGVISQGDPETSLTINATAAPSVSGCLRNSASVSVAPDFSGNDPNAANNSADVFIGAPECSDLALSSADLTEYLDPLRSVLVVQEFSLRNLGPTDATNVVIQADWIESQDCGNIIDCNVFWRVFDPAGNLVGEGLNVDGLTEPFAIAAGTAATIRLSVEIRSEAAFLSVVVDYAFTVFPGDLSAAVISGAMPPVSETTWDYAPSNNDISSSLEVFSPSTINPTSGRCFIATAAYGSFLAPEVETLRAFRDEHLLTNAPGRAFVDFYYRHAPPVAEFIAGSEAARLLARVVLAPLVYTISYPGAATAFWVGLIVLPYWIRRRRRKVAGLGE